MKPSNISEKKLKSLAKRPICKRDRLWLIRLNKGGYPSGMAPSIWEKFIAKGWITYGLTKKGTSAAVIERIKDL